VAAHLAWHPSELQAHALERYAVHNPSFLLTDSLLRERQESSRFDRFLRANTGLTDTTAADGDRPSRCSALPSRPPGCWCSCSSSIRCVPTTCPTTRRATPNLEAFAKENVCSRMRSRARRHRPVDAGDLGGPVLRISSMCCPSA
jgi:hypothetical protein